mmetsp:Transcript_46252/g.130222  ORF Transcript_46252/g.130222 Transcript_46252/m.130222 type:complete len:465 (-) Transcript_46252:571-1965(-)
MRNARSTACASMAGFHAGSMMITRSAFVKFRPTPPTLVVSNMHWNREVSLWNLATFSARAWGSVCPSMRKQRRPEGFKQHTCTRSNILTLCEKTNVRCPRLASAGNNLAMQLSLELCCSNASTVRGSRFSCVSTARPHLASSCTVPAAPKARLSWVLSKAMAWSSAGAAEGDAAMAGSGDAGSAASWPSAAKPSALAFCTASESNSAQAPGFGHGTNSAGWLHNRFRSPIARKTSMPNFCLTQASRMISLFSRIRLYAEAWSSLGCNQMMVSVFGGNRLTSFVSTSVSMPASPSASTAPSSAIKPVPNFVRRRMCGLMRLRSCSDKCFLSSTAQTFAPRTLPRSIGSLKVLTNVAWLPNKPGWAKSINAHKSCNAFWTGVPVSKIRHFERSCRNVLPNSVEMFFILWASSQMTMSHGSASPDRASSPAGSSTFCGDSPSSSLSSGSSSSKRLRFAAPAVGRRSP